MTSIGPAPPKRFDASCRADLDEGLDILEAGIDAALEAA